MPNSSPPKLEDSLWVENPLAEMLKDEAADYAFGLLMR